MTADPSDSLRKTYRWRRQRWREAFSIDPRMRGIAMDAERPAGVAAPEEVPVTLVLNSIVDRLPSDFESSSRMGRFAAGTVKVEKITDLRLDTLTRSLKLGVRLRRAVDSASRSAIRLESARRVATPRPEAPQPKAIVALIDFNCGVLHPTFVGPRGTRFRAVWDQRVKAVAAKSRVAYGREFKRQDIESARATIGEGPGQVDWIEAQRLLGCPVDPIDDSHGTSVLDLAAGEEGVAPDADLIAVLLPDGGDDTTAGTTRNLIDAIHYVLDRASDTSDGEPDLPVVIVISLETHVGPHDGSGPVERVIDDVCATPGRAVVIASGNCAARRLHVGGMIAARTSPGEPQTAPSDSDFVARFGESAGDARHSDVAEIDLWYEPAAPSTADRNLMAKSVQVDVELFGVDRSRVKGTGLHAIGPGHWRLFEVGPDGKASGDWVMELLHRPHDPMNGANEIRLATRAGALPSSFVANVGLGWVGPPQDQSLRFDAWFAYDERGRICWFPSARANDQLTVNSIGTGALTITVGATDSVSTDRASTPAQMSGRGPTRGPNGRPKPDLSAPGTAVKVLSLPGRVRGEPEWVLDSGTSYAAPLVAGVVARMYEASAPDRMPIDLLRRLLTGSADTPDAATWSTWMGEGVVHAEASTLGVAAWREIASSLRSPEALRALLRSSRRWKSPPA